MEKVLVSQNLKVLIFKEVFKMGIMISIILACFMSFLMGIMVGYESGK